MLHVEKEFYNEVRREETIRKRRREENRKKEEGKKNFVMKFFPTFSNSPGGKEYLNGMPSTNSTAGSVVGKIETERSNPSSENIIVSKKLNLHFKDTLS